MSNLNSIFPCFIVENLNSSVSFYADLLGFEIKHLGPEEDPYWSIVGRDQISILLKAVAPEVIPIPNHGRHEFAPWDAYIFTLDPATLYDEYIRKNVAFHKHLQVNSDHLLGFEIKDIDGYVLFFGKPK